MEIVNTWNLLKNICNEIKSEDKMCCDSIVNVSKIAYRVGFKTVFEFNQYIDKYGLVMACYYGRLPRVECNNPKLVVLMAE